MSRQPLPADSFGVQIRQSRNAHGWTQAQLAARADVSRPTVARVETGDDVSTATLSKIARALGLALRIEPAD